MFLLPTLGNFLPFHPILNSYHSNQPGESILVKDGVVEDSGDQDGKGSD